MTGIIVFAHGSRIEPANEAVRTVAANLATAGNFLYSKPLFSTWPASPPRRRHHCSRKASPASSSFPISSPGHAPGARPSPPHRAIAQAPPVSPFPLRRRSTGALTAPSLSPREQCLCRLLVSASCSLLPKASPAHQSQHPLKQYHNAMESAAEIKP